MSKVILSGGDLGGEVVDWPIGQEIQVIWGYRYRLVEGSLAIYEGAE